MNRNQDYIKKVCGIAKEYGFHHIKTDRNHAMVFENQGVRMRITGSKKSGAEMITELIGPSGNGQLIPHYLSTHGVRTENLRIIGEQVLLQECAKDFVELKQILMKAANITILSKKEEDNSFDRNILRQVPNVACDSQNIDTKALERLRSALQHFKTFFVKTNITTLSACLHTFHLRQIFEINPVMIATNFNGLFTALEKMLSLDGIVIIINTDFLEDIHRRKIMKFLERFNLHPEFFGPRFLLYSDSQTGDECEMPEISLPSVNRHLVPILEDAGLTANRQMVTTCQHLLKGKLTQEEAIEYLRDEKNSEAVSREYATKFRIGAQRDVSLRKRDRKTIMALMAKARKTLDNYIVGRSEIKNELLPLLAMWCLMNIKKPLILAFVGPTGTGKNILCETLAFIAHEYFKTNAPHYVSFNAGCLIDRTSLWNLTGTQKGLKGMEAPGILETIRKGSVLTLDEIDKLEGRNDIQHFLTGLLDNGTFRNGHGKEIDLPPCIIVLTMNAGNYSDAEKWERIGFSGDGVRSENQMLIEHYKEAYQRIILPAIQGRVRRVLYFPAISENELMEIAKKDLLELKKVVERIGFDWTVSDIEKTAKQIVEKTDIRLGARGVQNELDKFKNTLFENLWKE